MKIKLSLIAILIITFTIQSTAQIGIGLKFGLSSFDMAQDGIIIKDNDTDKYKINYEDSKYGYHFGVYADAQLSFLSFQPALIFNTAKIDYSITDIDATSIVKSYKRYNNLDIPVLFGFNISRVRFHGGPVAHILLSSSKDILKTDEYEEMFKRATYSYQAGISVQLLWNMKIEVNYEGGLDKFGQQFIYKGEQYQFSKRPERIVASFLMSFI